MRKPISALIAVSMAAAPLAAVAQQEVPAVEPVQAPMAAPTPTPQPQSQEAVPAPVQPTAPASAQSQPQPAEPEKPKPVVAVSGTVGSLVGSVAGAAGGPVGKVAGGWVGGKLGRGVGRFLHKIFGGGKKKAAEAPVQTATTEPLAQSAQTAAQPASATVEANTPPVAQTAAPAPVQ